MNGTTRLNSPDLAVKIARLVEERGWNQEDFARIANLNRQTVRDILQQNNERRLRNATVSACARALGLTVSELHNLPLERLLPRMNQQASEGDPLLRRLYEEATQPELLSWLERNADRARQLTADEIDELLSLQGTGGPLTSFGVQHFVEQIERKRRLLQQVQVVAGTEYLDLLEQLVGLLYDKVQPYRDRV
jgi:transcriptional regulator with XRE-family HTH domain